MTHDCRAAAGTVVDRVITHPRESDFFLISQAGLKGTSRPAHYHVLMDQNNLSTDEIQQFCYKCAPHLMICVGAVGWLHALCLNRLPLHSQLCVFLWSACTFGKCR